MSDLIKRSDAIEAIEVVDWYHQNRNKDMVSGANDDEHQAWYKADDIYKALESIPSARPEGEWASVLAELHERFDALEKEIRKASAEMSAVIRECVDGLKEEPQTCSFWLHMDCSLCWKESHCRAIKEAERKEREGE